MVISRYSPIRSIDSITFRSKKKYSKCPNYADLRPKSVAVEFLQAIPASFKSSFWPQSFGVESISSFYSDFFHYMENTMEPPSNLDDKVTGFFGEIVISALVYSDGVGISRVFLNVVSQNFPPAISSKDTGRLVTLLLESFSFVEPISPRDVLRLTSETFRRIVHRMKLTTSSIDMIVQDQLMKLLRRAVQLRGLLNRLGLCRLE